MTPAYRRRRSAHTPAAGGSKWCRPEKRWAIYYRDNFECVYCLRVGQLSLDHVRAVGIDGKQDNAPTNLVTCCIPCNSTKQALTRRQWYAVLAGRGVIVATVRRRIARLTAKPLDRVRGTFLAGSGHVDDHDAEAAEVPESAPDKVDPESRCGCCIDNATGDGVCEGSDTARCMLLPKPHTCGDCAHVKHCESMYGIEKSNTSCDFHPRRFLLRTG